MEEILGKRQQSSPKVESTNGSATSHFQNDSTKKINLDIQSSYEKNNSNTNRQSGETSGISRSSHRLPLSSNMSNRYINMGSKTPCGSNNQIRNFPPYISNNKTSNLEGGVFSPYDCNHLIYNPNCLNYGDIDGVSQRRCFIPSPYLIPCEASHISIIVSSIYVKFINEIKKVPFKGPMDDYSDQQIDQVIRSLPPFVSYSTWLANNTKKVRIFSRCQLGKNIVIAQFSAPLSPNINTNMLYERFINSTLYEKPWIKIIRDTTVQPNVDIYFVGPDILYRTNSIIEPGVQIVANFKNLNTYYSNLMPHIPSYQFSSSPKFNQRKLEFSNIQQNKRWTFNDHCNDNHFPPISSINYKNPTPQMKNYDLNSHAANGLCNMLIENSTIVESFTQSPPNDSSTIASEQDYHRTINDSTSIIKQFNLSSPSHSNLTTTNTDSPLSTGTKFSTVEDDIQGYSCPYCERLFSYKSYLEKHLRFSKCVDDGKRDFPCHLCSRSFNKNERLRVHISHVHEQNRPYICSYCNKAFTQSSSLNKHIRHHTGEKPYSCDVCGRKFSASSILRTHTRQHTGEKPFKCVKCGRAFSSHASLDSHIKRIHIS